MKKIVTLLAVMGLLSFVGCGGGDGEGDGGGDSVANTTATTDISPTPGEWNGGGMKFTVNTDSVPYSLSISQFIIAGDTTDVSDNPVLNHIVHGQSYLEVTSYNEGGARYGIKGVSGITITFRDANTATVVITGYGATTFDVVAAAVAAAASTTTTTTTAIVTASDPVTLDLGNGVKMEFVGISAGFFMMGSDSMVKLGPVHKVTLTKSFHLGKFEVTQEQWQQIMGRNPSYRIVAGGPVTMVSWNDCQEFLDKLAQKTGRNVRLPTEAEWEYACRAGTSAAYYFGDDASRLGEYAWFSDNTSTGEIHQPGQKKPNSWGLHDMIGNVSEWCSDWYGRYGSAEETDPVGPAAGEYRITRGRSWASLASQCISAERDIASPTGDNYVAIGLRVLLVQ